MSTAEQALVAVPAGGTAADNSSPVSKWHGLREVPLRLSVDISMPSMSLRALGSLQPGQVLPSLIPTADDLTVEVGGSPVCHARFEYMENRMSIRVTSLVGPSAHVAAAPSTAPPSAGAAA